MIGKGSSQKVLGFQHKSIPRQLWGRTVDEVVSAHCTIDDLATPILTLERGAAARNVERMLEWTHRTGVQIAPHGKTTMAPELWRRFVDAGAWGITVATPWQAEIAIAAGVERVMIANEVADRQGIATIAAATDAGTEIMCWVDSLEGVRLLAEGAKQQPIRVLVEFGLRGGRAGARGQEAARQVAEAVHDTPNLELRGVAGYEWTYGSKRTPEDERSVSEFLDGMAELFDHLKQSGAFEQVPIITAGGSIWFDVVARQFAQWSEHAQIVVRSGCVHASDHGFFAEQSPFAGRPFELEPALSVWASVISVPEPGIAILNAGRRDLSDDVGVPRALDIAGATIERLNDQHAWMHFPDDVDDVTVGKVVRLGISHPCTTFDRWRLIPEIQSPEDPKILGFVETYF